MNCCSHLVSLMLSTPKSYVLVLATLGAANCFTVTAQTQRQDLRPKDSKSVSARGKQIFASTCAGCHGLDGRGGERAPNIAENRKAQSLSDTRIVDIVENGIPGTGMPALRSLGPSDIKVVVAYLRELQGKNETLKLPGNPELGETIFFGKAGCAGCHMVEGKGGFIASDLSEFARAHDAQQTRSAIISPAQNSDGQARLVAATTRGGEKFAGRVRNEDNFSLQLQELDGTYRFLAKADLIGLEYSSQSLMPSDYGSSLDVCELNDVVSYLMSVANAHPSRAPVKADEEE
jgi:cytochrome c oxidase cbb3-type subunit 3